MNELAATIIVNVMLIYMSIGIVFAIVFVCAGAARIDPSAEGSTTGFKLLIIPGAAALWPLLLKRWISKQSRPPEEKNPHRVAACKLHPLNSNGGKA